MNKECYGSISISAEEIQKAAERQKEVMCQMIEVSPTTGWRRIFFWRKRVFKPWWEVVKVVKDQN